MLLTLLEHVGEQLSELQRGSIYGLDPVVLKRPFPILGEYLMTRDEIKDVILEIIQDIDEDGEVENLNADAPLRDQLDLDSMDFLDIVMELRKRYQLQIPEGDYPELASLSSCVNYLEPRLKDV